VTKIEKSNWEAWDSFDEDTKLKSADGEVLRVDGEAQVDHGASALENLKLAGQELAVPFIAAAGVGAALVFRDCDDFSTMRSGGYSGIGDYTTNVGEALLRFGVSLFAPLMAVKDTVDAAVHGIMAGLRK
jgi:hypothetical protein